MSPKKLSSWLERFRRRAPEKEESPAENQREPYRYEVPKDSQEWRVGIQRRVGPEFPGQLQNVNIGGVSVLFSLAEDPGLAPGETTELVIENLTHGEKVSTPARVAHVEQGGPQHWRYGFEFISAGNLYAQLDAFYARVFNRRTEKRVEPPVERRIAVEITWRAERFKGRLQDVSASGLGVWISDEAAAKLEGVDEVGARFRLYGGGDFLAGKAEIMHRAPVLGRHLLGLRFDLDSESGFSLHREAICDYVDQRTREIERWAGAFQAG